MLPHKTQSKIEGKHSANPAFEGGQGGPGSLGKRSNQETQKKLQKARMRGGAGGPGVQGCLGGSRGFQGRSRGVERFWAEKRLNTKNRNMATNIQDFVQEVPVGQMAPQNLPPHFKMSGRGKGGLNLPTGLADCCVILNKNTGHNPKKLHRSLQV